MTQEEIRKKGFEKYPGIISIDEAGFPVDEQEALRNAYMRGLEDAQLKTKITGWVARDECGELAFFTGKPYRDTSIAGDGLWRVDDLLQYIMLDPSLYSEITWKSEPKEITLYLD